MALICLCCGEALVEKRAHACVSERSSRQIAVNLYVRILRKSRVRVGKFFRVRLVIVRVFFRVIGELWFGVVLNNGISDVLKRNLPLILILENKILFFCKLIILNIAYFM